MKKKKKKMKKVNVNERILDQLNHHGYFFQYAIDNILKDMKWNTTLEYPLPSNIFIEKKDIGESTDIFAGKMINNRQISLIVECKKVNTNECQWIFFEGEKEDFKLWELYESLEEKKEQFLSLLFRKSNLMRLQDFITAINGKEINYKKMGNRYRSDNIYKSVLQCSYSLHSIKEKIYDEYESGNSWYLYKSWHFIPIVVTNAKLKICKFDDISLSLESGKMPLDKVSFGVKNIIIYKFPLPIDLSFNQRDNKNSVYNEEINYLPIIIVNSKYMKKFLEDIFHYFSHVVIE